MITKEKARQLRKLIEKTSVSLPDEDGLEAAELFPTWMVDIAYFVVGWELYTG